MALMVTSLEEGEREVMPSVFLVVFIYSASLLPGRWAERSAPRKPAARLWWSQECAGVVGDGQVEVLRRAVRLQAAAGLPLVDFGGKSLFEAAVPVPAVLQTGHDHLSKVLLEPLEILPNDRKRSAWVRGGSQIWCIVALILSKEGWGSVRVRPGFTHAVGGVGRLYAFPVTPVNQYVISLPLPYGSGRQSHPQRQVTIRESKRALAHLQVRLSSFFIFKFTVCSLQGVDG